MLVARSFRIWIISYLPGRSRKAVGSSSITIPVSWASVLAIIALCLSPSEISETGFCSNPSSPANLIACCTNCLSRCFNLPAQLVCGNLPNATRSKTFRLAIRTGSVETKLMILAASILLSSFISVPFITIAPDRDFCKFASVRNKVLFPIPFCPIKATSSPLAAETLIPEYTISFL